MQVRATLKNADDRLRPGCSPGVDRGRRAADYVTLPETAVAYNSYGNIVYLVVHKADERAGKPQRVVQQTFVTAGPTRGDQIAILKGVKDGDTVVSAGQMKLHNGAPVPSTIRSKPADNPHPAPVETNRIAAMNFTDIFIRRPVLATVISLMIFALGLRALGSLPVLQYPRTQNAVVTVTTTYYGADPDVIAGFITTPLENAIAQANGIDYMTSASQSGVSVITVYLRLNYDADKALTEISTKVSSVLNQLPSGSQQPILTVKIGQTIDAMYLASTAMCCAQQDHRLFDPRGAAEATGGDRRADRGNPGRPELRAACLARPGQARRLWTDRHRRQHRARAKRLHFRPRHHQGRNGAGQSNRFDRTAHGRQFANLIVKHANGAIVRLKDVANVTLGADTYETEVAFDGKPAVYIGIQIAPTANLLDVIAGVRKIFPGSMPSSQRTAWAIVYDSTDFVNSASATCSDPGRGAGDREPRGFPVPGSLRSVLIPMVAIPLSLIGAFTIMLALGFSINLLTLLALVLGIGLVVDDAIIVVENVNRHLEEAEPPIQAAIHARANSGGRSSR